MAAITTYGKTAGSTWYSRENAAARAHNEIKTALEMADQSGTVGADLTTLYQEFGILSEAAQVEDSSDYNIVAAQISVDARLLEEDCNTG